MIDSRLADYLCESSAIADSPDELCTTEITEGLLALGEWASTLGSTGAPERQRAYEALCYPNDPPGPQVQATADKQYSCGLVQLGLLRLIGYRGPELEHTIASHLRGGGALAALERLGRAANAWASKPNFSPEPGEIWVIGSGGNDSHALLVLAIEQSGSGLIVTSCDGGQPEAGGMGCKKRTRLFQGGRWQAVDGNHQPIPGNGVRGSYGTIMTHELPWLLFTGPRHLPV